MDPRSWWRHLGRSRGPSGSRPCGGHRGQRQATRRRWGQGIRQWRARRQAIHEWGWGPLDAWGSSWETGWGRWLFHFKVELKKKLQGRRVRGWRSRGGGGRGVPRQVLPHLTCLVSRFQWVQNLPSALSISRLGTWGREAEAAPWDQYKQTNLNLSFSSSPQGHYLEGNGLIGLSSHE